MRNARIDRVITQTTPPYSIYAYTHTNFFHKFVNSYLYPFTKCL